MSSFKDNGFVGEEPVGVVSEIHGFVDERALHGDGIKPEEVRELKDALDAWCKDRFGIVPMELLKSKAN